MRICSAQFSSVRTFQYFALCFTIVLISNASCEAAIQTYEVRDIYSSSVAEFSASWLHSADASVNGTVENGARRNGLTSSRLTGSLQADLSGNVLSDVTGVVQGNLGQLASSLNAQLGLGLLPQDAFELRLGGAAGGSGAIQLLSADEFTGGYLDYSLYVGSVGDTVASGTFFYKPQAELGNALLDPNRGDANAFTLWGNNWMHDGSPVAGSNEPDFTDWQSFLSPLGYTGGNVLRSAGGLDAELGTSFYLVNQNQLANPEPTALVVWSLLGISCSAYRRRRS